MARRHRFLDGVAALDFQLLRTIKDMTSHLEVGQCHHGRMGASHSAGLQGLARGARRARWPYRRRSGRAAESPFSVRPPITCRPVEPPPSTQEPLAIAMPPAWLMLSFQAVTPSAVAAFAAPPESRTSGAAPGARCIITSVKATPAPKPMPIALSTASLAANRPASRSIRLTPPPTSSSSVCTKQRGINGSRGSSIQRRISATITKSMPCPTTVTGFVFP